MNLSEATATAIHLIRADLAAVGAADAVSAASPDGDPGKFTLLGLPARTIAHRDGFYINANPAWFAGVDAPAEISGGPIAFYVYVIPGLVPRYWVCSWRTMMALAREFNGPTRDHYHQTIRWRSLLRGLRESPDAALFYWGDERAAEHLHHGWRIMDLNNAAAVVSEEIHRQAARPGRFAPGGEGQAHKLLKLYVAQHPELVGASARAIPRVEYVFRTGDRVDLMFENHDPERTVVEVEVAGRDNLLVGVQQAVKYAALAGVERRAPLVSPRIRAHVVAYETNYPAVIELAGAYGINLVTVDPHLSLVA